MSENAYRAAKAVLLGVFVVGFLLIAHRFSENGRYVQYDMRRCSSPDGRTTMADPPYQIFDTRTGHVLRPSK